MRRTLVIGAYLAFLVTTGDAHAQALDDGLTGYWPLDQTEGDSVFNVAGAEEVGTIFGADWVMDEGRSALSFNRSEQDYVETTYFVPPLRVVEDNFTWSYWGKNGSGNGANDVILGNRYCGDVGVDCNPRQFIKFTPTRFEYDRLDVGPEDISYSGGALEADGPWTHHLVTKVGPTLTYYRNGQFDADVTLTDSVDFQDPQPFYFAGDRTLENWTGLMDDVALWTRALSEGDIASIAAAGAEGLKSLIEGDPLPAPVAGRNMIGTQTISSSIVDGSLEFGPSEGGPGLAQEWFAVANPGDKAGVDNIFANNFPVVPAFRSSGGSFWTGSGSLPGVQNYPPEVQPPLTDNYTVRLTGEILIEQDGLITFLDGVDDFSYLAIDKDRSGTAGDNPDEVLINDNTWTNPIRDANGGGEGWVETTFENVAEGGEWLALEANVAEGGGGDHGVFYWDYDVNAPIDQRNQGLLVPFADQAFFDDQEAVDALIPDSHLRAETAPLLAGEVEGSVPTSPLGWEFDVNANDGTADAFVLDNPDPAIFSSTLDVEGAQFVINVLDGEVSEGDSFPILVADNFTGTPTIATDGWTYDAATGSVVFGTVTQLCGDFDMDGDVDVADRTIQTINWTGAGNVPEPPKTFADGDCDGDGDVDVADQTGTIQNWTGAQAGNLVDGDDADLRYDPASGNVTLDASDTASGKILSFVIGTGNNDLRTDNFMEPFINVGTNTDNTVFQIGQTDPLNQGQGPTINLGDIFPPGIADEQGLSDYLSLAEYASDLGAGGTLDLVVIPEPTSITLALLGLLALMGYSGRRRG